MATDSDKSSIKSDILFRVRVTYLIFIILGMAIIAKIVMIQSDEQIRQKQEAVYSVLYKMEPVEALRGDILDRNGEVLATTVWRFDLRLDLMAPVIELTMIASIKKDIDRRAKAEKERIKKDENIRGKRKKIKVIERQRIAQRKDSVAVKKAADRLLKLQMDTLASGLSSMFGDASAASYLSMLKEAKSKKNTYLRLNPKKLSYEDLYTLLHLPLLRIKRVDSDGGGILVHEPVRGCTIIEEYTSRERPYGSLARQTIGMTKIDSMVTYKDTNNDRHIKLKAYGIDIDTSAVVKYRKRGVHYDSVKYGLERSFDNYLKGKDGKRLIQVVSGIMRVPVKSKKNVAVEHGTTVVTTIDVRLQDIAESELRKQLELQKAKWGCVVLMEVSTGEIHALCNLSRRADGEILEDMNYATLRNMEPGSTFKLISLITLLDDAGMSITDDMITTEGGQAMVKRAKVRESEGHNYGTLNLHKAFVLSSNVAFAKAVDEAYSNDPRRFVDYVCSIGLDKPLNIEMERIAPEIKKPKTATQPAQGDWTEGMTLQYMAYGYSFATTPMRTLTMYNAIANNGKMISPTLVKELRREGQTVRLFSAKTIVEQICKPATLPLIRNAMEQVVEQGTAKVLKNPNYKVAAKTGTAGIPFDNKGYRDARGGEKYAASIVGYFPADKPKYSCIVVMETYYGPGSYHQYFGASLSGPVFRAVADRVYASQKEWRSNATDGNAPVKQQVAVKGGKAEDIKVVVSDLDLKLEGADKINGWALSGTDSTGTHVKEVELIPGKVPDVSGMGLREAMYILESRGLKVRFSGKGKVVWQSVAAGAKIYRGGVIVLKLEI